MPSTDFGLSFSLISPMGVNGEWICNYCLDQVELGDGIPFYVHTKKCRKNCDFFCNGDFGLELAKQMKTYIKFPHDGKEVQS